MYSEDRVFVRETALNMAVKLIPNLGGDPLVMAKRFEEWITEPVEGDTVRPEGNFITKLGPVLD